MKGSSGTVRGLIRHENGQSYSKGWTSGMSKEPDRHLRPTMQLEGVSECSPVEGLVASEKELRSGMSSGNGRPHTELD